MATGQAIVTQLKEIKPIEGADNICQATIYGETVIISKDNKEGDWGILFDTETQLSDKFCKLNNLYRHSYLNSDTTQSGYIEDNRRVRPIKLKGVKCSGLWLPISCLQPFSEKTEDIFLDEGIQFNEFNGEEICRKYISLQTRQKQQKNQKGKARKHLIPLFKEHIETDHFLRNLNHINIGDIVYLSEKLHGTSGRASFTPVKRNLNWFEKLLSKFVPIQETEYKFVVGSRRVVKSIEGEEVCNKNHFYNSDIWTEVAYKNFKDKLHPNETIYFEIVGYTPDNNPIMGIHDNSKLKKFLDKKEYKDFINKYSNTTEFHYGCQTNDIYVYRITMDNGFGKSVDLSWWQVVQRCYELDVKHVPSLASNFAIEEKQDIEDLKYMVETHSHHDSGNFPQHISEGVVIRIENGHKRPIFLKNKNFIFKCLEGIIKESNQVDIEETN